jgi:hypothetical protein
MYISATMLRRKTIPFLSSYVDRHETTAPEVCACELMCREKW